MEKWNVYNRQGHCQEGYLIRGQAIPKGQYHLVAEVMVQDKAGNLLLVQRHPDKTSYPAYFEASAGGSVLFGEMAEQAARRELFEETGLRATSLQLIREMIFDEDATIIRRYQTKLDQVKPTIDLQADESVAALWLSPKDIPNFLKNENIIPRQKDDVMSLLG